MFKNDIFPCALHQMQIAGKTRETAAKSFKIIIYFRYTFIKKIDTKNHNEEIN